MMSATGVHALRACAALARLSRGGVYVGSAELARTVSAPPNYLGKLLRQLARQGLVESQRGKSGGFRLARDPATITLLDILEPVARVRRWTGCFLGHAVCSNLTPCSLHPRWKKARDAYFEFLADTTVADLAVEFVPGNTRRRQQRHS